MPKLSKILLCNVFNIPRSTLYYKKKKRVWDLILETKIKVIHIFDPFYWHRRIAWDLKINKKTSSRIMQKSKIYAKTRKKRNFTKPWDKNLPNMWVANIKKEIKINNINQVWSSDFTHLYFKQVEFYLATILDEYSKEIVGYKIWFNHEKELIISTVRNAISRAEQTPDILHSDQWSEYRSYEYFEALKQYSISASMSRKASPWENGSQESFYWKFKFELWNLNKYSTVEEAIEAVHLQIYYYNNHRIHTTLKMSPIQFKELHSNTAKSV
jgi:transposase InsO family protein